MTTSTKNDTKSNIARQPEGALILRTLAMPSDTNANGDIFGGWIMSQMDVTGAVDKIVFLRPIAVGDVVCCYGKLTEVGRTSMQVKVEVWIKKVYEGVRDRVCVTEALFTYVAIDKEGKPRPVPKEDNPELEQALTLLNKPN